MNEIQLYSYRIRLMSDDKRMKVDNVESISKKMNGVEWRMKWKEYLKESASSCMFWKEAKIRKAELVFLLVRKSGTVWFATGSSD